MTPITWATAGRQSTLGLLGKALGGGTRSVARAAGRAGLFTAGVLQLALRFLLVVAGLGFLDLAAWMWHRPAGCAAVGLSLLVLEWAVKRE